MTNGFYVRRAAVLGAGVMGAQIAAHLVNAGVATVLFELPADGADPNANVRKAVAGLRKLQPSPLAAADVADLIEQANYRSDLPRLGDCDLVVEAIAERMDLKQDLYRRIHPHLGERTVLVSNTSGLNIDDLSGAMPEQVRRRFCGVHFFNPPRYMHLVELIAGKDTEVAVLDALESFLVQTLGKGVVRAKDTPGFIANRVGVFAVLAAIHHAQRLDLPLDVVDALTGPLIGRPKSATFRTADVVGLDTLAHVVDGTAEALASDPWRDYYRLPDWMRGLIEQGALGQKAGIGVYRKDKSGIQVLDPATGKYRPSRLEVSAEIQPLLAIHDASERFAALRKSDHPQANYLWAIHRDVFHYAAYHLETIADNARDLDFAIRWGFGWKQGPLEIWQAAGWRQVARWLEEEIADGSTMASAPLPRWVGDVHGVHRPEGSWSPGGGLYRPRSGLPVYERQYYPERPMGGPRLEPGKTLFENSGVRLWQLDDDIAVLSFRSKMHTIGEAVLSGTMEAIDIAERDFAGLIIWHPREPFGAGADLALLGDAARAGRFEEIDAVVSRFQAMTARVRYSTIPVVSACRGLAVGGACEVLMHSDRVVVALESYVGLVEAGVGLLPAGGGCKTLASRAAAQSPDGDVQPYLNDYFKTVAMATVANSAREARQKGFLRPADVVVANPNEILHVAAVQVRAMAETGYRPPLPRRTPVAGLPGIAVLQGTLVNMRDGGFISEHDYAVSLAIAEALCGGRVDAGTVVDEDWLLTVERKAFVELCRQPKTQERIAHVLKTGKPLRN